jgi:hypothetical protein
VSTAEEWIDQAIHPNSPGGPLPCVSYVLPDLGSQLMLSQFLQKASKEAVAGMYGENFARLAEVKSKFDPNNFFRHAVWPRQASPEEFEIDDGPKAAEGTGSV